MATQQHKPATNQQPLQRTARQPQRSLGRGRQCSGASRLELDDGRRPSQQQRERQLGCGTEHRDAQIGVTPTRVLDEVLNDRRPYRTGKIISTGEDRHRDASSAHEPQRRMREQRGEGRRAPRADEQALRQRVVPEARRGAGCGVTDRQRSRSEDHRSHDAAIGEATHGDAGDAETDHGQGVRQRRSGSSHAEFRLHRGQRDDHRPHAHAADRREQKRHREPEPGVARFDALVRVSTLGSCDAAGLRPGAGGMFHRS